MQVFLAKLNWQDVFPENMTQDIGTYPCLIWNCNSQDATVCGVLNVLLLLFFELLLGSLTKAVNCEQLNVNYFKLP